MRNIIKYKILGYDIAAQALNVGMGGQMTTNQIMGGVSGTIINPNVELMYEAPELRGFNLNFKMMPRDPQESRDIFGICQTLKKAMLPSWGGKIKGGEVGVGSLLTLPKIVSVKFMTGNRLNKYVTQYKPCAITNVSINYTPDGNYATYQDGSPVATLLSVQFKELKLVFEQEVPLPNSSNSAVSSSHKKILQQSATTDSRIRAIIKLRTSPKESLYPVSCKIRFSCKPINEAPHSSFLKLARVH